MAKKKNKGKGSKSSGTDKGDKLTPKNKSKEKQVTEAKEYEEVRPKG